MKLIVGLGNPGIQYESTPHNLGFLALDRIAKQCGVEIRNRQCRALTARTTIGAEAVLLAKPETFMNRSGESVRELVAEYDIVAESDLIVLQDELDFPWGTVRVQRNRSAAGHHGIESLIEALGTQDFLRIRMGVGPERKVEDGIRYLLSPFPRARRPVIDAMLEQAAEAVEAILKEGRAAAMNRFNRKEPNAEN
nr:aminoacyl-tRNA hydrolase [Terriglobales bacterium]